MWQTFGLLLACVALPLHISEARTTQLKDSVASNQCADNAPKLPYVRLTAIPQTTSIAAAWNAPGNRACVDHYIVMVGLVGSKQQPKPHQVRLRSIIVSNLKPTTQYTVMVMAVNKHGTGPAAHATITTLTGPHCNPRLLPGQPVNAAVLAAPGRSDRVSVSWKSPTSPVNACYLGYRVLGYNVEKGARVLNVTLARAVKRLDINGLAAGTEYKFQISTLSNVGNSAAAVVAVTTNSLARVSPSPVRSAMPKTAATQPSLTGASEKPLSPRTVARQQPTTTTTTTTTSSSSSSKDQRPAAGPTQPSVSPALYVPASPGTLDTLGSAGNSGLGPTFPAAPVTTPTANGTASTILATVQHRAQPTTTTSTTPPSVPDGALPVGSSSAPAVTLAGTPSEATAVDNAVSNASGSSAAPDTSGEATAADNAVSNASGSSAAPDSNCLSDVEPPAVLNFTAIALSKSRIRLHWEHEAAGICTDGFKLDGYQLKSGDRVVGKQIVGTTYTLNNLAPGIEYAFTAAAVNKKGDSTPATAMVTTLKG